MLWIVASIFFLWCAFRGVNGPVLDGPSVLFVAIAALCAWQPISQWHFEHFLAAKATQLAGRPASVHCNSIFDTMLDSQVFSAGHASPQTGRIVFQFSWCKTLRAFLAHPSRATPDELFSFHMLTHESMHVRGEIREAVAECQAVQRDYIAAKLLGVPDALAKKVSREYFSSLYALKKNAGPMQSGYYSDECRPGGALDERLSESTWSVE